MSIDSRPLSIFLMGPTAAGKTALACELAERFALDLVSVDSALVYRGMDIGTAKPDAATLARFPHGLVDIRDPAQPYSAADFRIDALEAMHAATARGRIPLLVGGTGLYFRALQKGLSSLPAADGELRRQFEEDARVHGWPALHARLAKRDPVAAERIRPNDAQRIQRALEVIELGGGRPFSEQLADGAPARLPWRVLKLALVPADRAVLHARIEARFDAMLRDGFLDEARSLLARAELGPDLPAWRAVGYRQAREFLEGRTEPEVFRQRAIAATRQLAKRQITWLRGDLDARWIDPLRKGAAERVMGAVAGFTKTGPSGVCA